MEMKTEANQSKGATALLESDGQIRKIKKHIRRVMWLFCIVTLAVVSGNLISAAIIAQFTDDSAQTRIETALEAERKKSQHDNTKAFFAEEARKESDRLTKALEAHQRLMERAQDKNDRQVKLESQLNALCDFWISQYQKDQQESTKTQKDAACSEVGR